MFRKESSGKLLLYSVKFHYKEGFVHPVGGKTKLDLLMGMVHIHSWSSGVLTQYTLHIDCILIKPWSTSMKLGTQVPMKISLILKKFEKIDQTTLHDDSYKNTLHVLFASNVWISKNIRFRLKKPLDFNRNFENIEIWWKYLFIKKVSI